MGLRLKDKVAIVTGGGSGLGRAGATLMATEGAKVVIAEIDPEKGLRVAERIKTEGGKAVFIPVDVRSADSVKALVKATIASYGRIDVLYHNAVDVRFVNEHDRRLTELEDEDWEKMIQLVLTGTFHCCKYIALEMIKQKSGSIILTSTVDALIGCAGLDAYTAAKGGIISLTRSFAAGIAKEGVRVNTICPAFVATEPQQEWLARPAAARLMEALHLLPVAKPEQLAPFVVYLASDESAVVTGSIFTIDSGYMAFKANTELMEIVGSSRNQ